MKNRLIYAMTFAAVLVMFSCSKWLDVSPKNQIKNEDMFNEYSGFKDALTACYIKLNSQNLYGKNLTFSSVDFLAQLWDTDNSTTSLESALKDYDYKNSSVESNIQAIYSSLYNVIIQANTVIKNMPLKGHVIDNTSTRNVIEGEAYAIRAFCHLDILRLFGQMPKNPQRTISLPYSEDVSKEAVKYYSYSEYIKKIENDLNKAESLLKDNDLIFKYSFKYLDEKASELDDDFTGYRRFRFNYYAVKAIKARLYLYIGENDKAYSNAKEVIEAKNNDGSDLLNLAGTDDFNKNFYSLPSEAIVALSNSKLADYINKVFVRFGSNNPIYLNADKLNKDLFIGVASGSNRYYYAWNANNTNNSASARPIINKYYQEENTQYSPTILVTKKQVVPLIRLSEMYLIAIETTQSIAEANILYKTYMKAREILVTTDLNSKDEFYEQVIDEYRREFYGEGQMFYTYKRIAEKKMLWNDEREIGEAEYILPLPSSEYNPNK